METDLPGDGRFVLTERSGNSGLARIVANTDLDDPSFIEGAVSYTHLLRIKEIPVYRIKPATMMPI